MQENLEAFGVKIKSSFPARPESQPEGSAKPLRAAHEPRAEEEVERRIRERLFPESVHVRHSEVVPVGTDDGVVRDRGRSVPLQG